MKCNKELLYSIAVAIAIVVILSYILVMCVLYNGKKGFPFSASDFVVSVAFFVFLIGVESLILNKINDCLKFYEFSKQVISDLKLLTDTPDNQSSILISRSDFMNEWHKRLRLTGCVFFFPEFKSCFDGLLNKIINYNIFIEDQYGNIYIDNDAIKSRLSKEDRVLSVLAAQLIMKNPMLSITYSKSMLYHISRLSWCSVKDDSLIDRQNAAKKIVELLDNKVYASASWGELSSTLSESFSVIIEKNKSFLKVRPENLCSKNADCSKRESVLRGLLEIANLKYYFVNDIEGSKIRESIEKAGNIIDYCKRKSRSDANIRDVIDKLSEENFDIIGLKGSVCFEAGNGYKFSCLFEKASVLKQGDSKKMQKEDSTAAEIAPTTTLEYDCNPPPFSLEEILYHKNNLLKEIENCQNVMNEHVRLFDKKLKTGDGILTSLLEKYNKIFSAYIKSDKNFRLGPLLKNCQELYSAYSELWKKYCDLCVDQIDKNKSYCLKLPICESEDTFDEEFANQFGKRTALLNEINEVHSKLWNAIDELVRTPEVLCCVKEEIIAQLEKCIDYAWVESSNDALERLLEYQKDDICTFKYYVSQENDIKARMKQARKSLESDGITVVDQSAQGVGK